MTKQATTLTVMLVLMPRCHGKIVIKENMSTGSWPQDKETTTDEDGESELSELSTTPKAPCMVRKKVTLQKGQKQVPKTAEVLILDKPMTIPCD